MINNQILVKLDAAEVKFGAVGALRNINLALGRGERVALVGSNGSGKSTLLRLVHALLQPTRGRVERVALLQQAMVFQRPYMLGTTSLNNVALALWLAGKPWQQAKQLAQQALQKVELSAQAQRHAKALSGGQQQRLALARAWALQPDLLLLDEPTANLDPHAKREVEAILAELSADANMTLVFASHNLGQVKRLASRVIYLEQGQILADLPTADFFGGDLLKTSYPAAYAFVKGEG